MATYVDGYVIPVPKKNLATYLRMAKLGAKVWKDHGALEYQECVGDDLDVKFGLPFPKVIKTKPGETVVFSFIVYRSKAHRDKINARVMADPRIADAMKTMKMPFDCKRMLFGGFTTLVKA